MTNALKPNKTKINVQTQLNNWRYARAAHYFWQQDYLMHVTQPKHIYNSWLKTSISMNKHCMPCKQNLSITRVIDVWMWVCHFRILTSSQQVKLFSQNELCNKLKCSIRRKFELGTWEPFWIFILNPFVKWMKMINDQLSTHL